MVWRSMHDGMWKLARRRGLQGHPEADLGAISPGRAAAGGGHGGLARGGRCARAFCTIFMYCTI